MSHKCPDCNELCYYCYCGITDVGGESCKEIIDRLLEACYEALSGQPDYDKIRAAIAKAEGR